MRLGLVLGGAAEGFGKGVKLVNDYEKAQDEKKKRKREDDAYAITQGIPAVGEERPYDWTPDKAVQEAGASQPQQTGLVSSLARRLHRESAAAQAGIPTNASVAQAAQAQAAAQTEQGGTAAQAPAAAATGLPTGEATMPEVTVTPRPHVVTPVDQAAMMLAAAKKRGDPQAIQSAFEAMNKASQDAAASEVLMRGNTWDGLANIAFKATGTNVDFEPDPKDPSKATVTIDGEDQGVMTLRQARENMIGFIMKNPGVSLELAAKRTAEDRLEYAARNDVKYKEAELAVRQQNAATSRMAAQASAAKDQAALAAAQQKLQRSSKFQNMLVDGQDENGQGMGDAYLNRAALPAIASTAYDPVTKVVQDPTTGEQQIVTVAPGETIANAAIQAATARYQASPYVKSGLIREVTYNGKRYYQLNPEMGGNPKRLYTNLDAAENDARRVPKPKAK